MENLSLKEFDPQIADLIDLEQQRQIEKLEMIASENFVSPRVLEANGSVLTNKYAEGYPNKRYYGGCEYVDGVEQLAIDRAKDLFGAEFANVQPHSGSQANMAVYLSVLQPGDKILGLDLSHGGHLTHGAKVNFSGSIFESHFYQVRENDHRLDYDEILKKAKEVRPKVLVAGYSAYPRALDFKKFREIADEVGAYLMADIAHIAGIVAAGRHSSPFPHAHFVTTTTHKTLRGPRGGMILSTEELGKSINSKIFPGIQGGPLCHTICAKAIAFKEAGSESFKKYIDQVLKNSKCLAETLVERGYRLTTGGTDNHLMLIDFSATEITGKLAENVLDEANITSNKNTVPFEQRSPFVTSGIRLGSQALTSRGMKEEDMKKVADFIDRAIKNHEDKAQIQKIAGEVREFSLSFPGFAETV